MIDFLDPIQRRYRLISDPASLAEMLQREPARPVSGQRPP
jgi:hypothetical protein